MTEAAPAASSPRARWVPYAVVTAVGVLFATGAALGADRQPFVWVIPPLVLTAMLLITFALSDRRRDEEDARETAHSLGLRPLGVQPLPPLTPVLARAEPGIALVGELEDGGPPCRVARVHAGRGRDLAVCVTEGPDTPAFERPPRVLDHDLLPLPVGEGPGPLTADPHGLLGAETTAPAELAAWVEQHPLRLAVAAGDGTLVVAAPVARGGQPPFAELLAATRETRARLA
jgi:hypothetical protein